MTDVIWMLFAGLLMVASVLASRAADWLGVPALLIYIGVGMLVGSDVLGWVYFDNSALAQGIGSIALAYILFNGGLDTPFARIRPVVGSGLALSTVGVLLTASLVALPAMLLLRWSFPQGLLLGAIVASTDAAAVFSVIRGRGVGIRPRLAALLELESGSNDPMAYLLVVGVLQWMTLESSTPGAMIWMFTSQLVGGAAVGLVAGWLLPGLVNRARLTQEGLYPVLTLSAVLVVYAASSMMEVNPFLAVYLAGLGLGNATFVHRTTVTRFHDGVAWLMQVIMFLVLGLLAFPARLPEVLIPGLVLGAFLMFVARPLVAAALLLPAGWSVREVAFIGWMGLKGAVPIVLATFPLVAGVDGAEQIMPIVFFMVLLSTVVQGASVGASARWLGVREDEVRAPMAPLVFEPQGEGETELLELVVAVGARAQSARIFELGLPGDTLIALVSREGRFLIPRGEFLLEAGDRLQVLAHRDERNAIRRIVEG